MKPTPNPSLPWPIPYEAVLFISEKEDLALTAYQCEAGVWTIGWGDTEQVTKGMMITKEQADERLLCRLREFANAVEMACSITPTPEQLGAMVSLTYNIGTGNFQHSTVLKQHNQRNFDAAAKAFLLWDKYTDPATHELKQSDGLLHRRQQEAALYLNRPIGEVI